MTWVLVALVVWAATWRVNVLLARHGGRAARFMAPGVFGVAVVAIWECLVRGLEVSPVILPAPTAIAARIAVSADVLWGDFVQTIVRGALTGYAIGVVAALLVAVMADRWSFLQRGLLPLGNFAAALPIVGTAPILVMWFGFDWQSKAAVVVLMVFFPVLVNAVQGLRAAESMQRDLMRTYGASYGQTLLCLRAPAAMPSVFNGLKVSTTLALIGAIVAEFFGSPIEGMGFRISTEVGRLALDMVWAEITVAAVAGCAFYGLVALIERTTTFWHPSQRA